MKTYTIKEIFYSLQGEGFHAGTPAVFIRFAGCNLSCPFCDTDFKGGETMTAGEIVSRALATIQSSPGVSLVILTGGEPTLQVDAELCRALHTFFDTIAIETNGSRSIPAGVDWVTVSPKQRHNGPYRCIEEADEVKIVFDGKGDPQQDAARIVADFYYIQPCDTGNEADNYNIITKAVEWVKQHPNWSLSLQQQKILKVR